MNTVQEMQEWPTSRIFERLAKFGVKIDERTFVKMAGKYHTPTGIAKAWKLNKLADETEVAHMAAVLWDRLCPDMFRANEFEDLVQQGYELMAKRNDDQRRHFARKRKHPDKVSKKDDAAAKEQHDERTVNLVSLWLRAWDLIRELAKEQSIRSANQLNDRIRKHSKDIELPSNWIQDLEMELENLSWAERPANEARSAKVFTTPNHWVNERLRYVREVMATLPMSDETMIFNMRRDEAEACFILDNREMGDTLYAKLVEDEPSNPWAYIGWGDMYSPRYCALSCGPDIRAGPSNL